VLAGLAALHRAGVVHGAFSPDCVFVDARVGGFTTPPSRTAGYLAPEQLANQPATARSDQFSACVAIYEALANKKPFSGATPGALAVAMSSPPEPPAALDRRVFEVLARGLAADPAKRWPDVDALADALARPPRSRAPFVAAGVALVAMAIVVALLAR
jgi:serine/threonine protein kinase